MHLCKVKPALLINFGEAAMICHIVADATFKLKYMKPLKIVLAGIIFFLAGASHAQIDVNITIGSPPAWGPVGYSEVEYYYLPDVQAYYDVRTSMFIYNSRGAWIHRSYLPYRYRNYDLYHGYKVVLTDYHGKTPYVHYGEHRKNYGKGYKGSHQKTIGERPSNHNSRATRHNVRSNSNHDQGRDARHSNDSRGKHNSGKKGGKKK